MTRLPPYRVLAPFCYSHGATPDASAKRPTSARPRERVARRSFALVHLSAPVSRACRHSTGRDTNAEAYRFDGGTRRYPCNCAIIVCRAAVSANASRGRRVYSSTPRGFGPLILRRHRPARLLVARHK